MSQFLKIGSLLDHGKYRIEKVLGQGGFGITYLATDLGLDKPRAIKEFFPKQYCDRDGESGSISLGTANNAEFVNQFKKKFIKEARNIANLDQHDGIIRIHSVFEENNTAYYVMDFIDGESLSSMVKRTGPMPVNRAVKYIKEAGKALEYVHSQRINHLDIKPANIMIRRQDDKAILIDFGLAKQYDSDGVQTSTTPHGISHGYAPIEQYDPRGLSQFSPQTDIYSLAATLFYLVVGQTPPYATDLASQDDFNFPVPQALYPAIMWGMSYSARQRPATVSDFLLALDGANTASRPTKKPQTSGVEIVGVVPSQPEAPEPIRHTAERQAVAAPTPQPISSPASYHSTSNKSSDDGYKGRSTKNPKFVRNVIMAASAVILGAIAFFVIINVKSSTSDGGTSTEVAAQTVTDMAYATPLGECLYTGTVNADGVPDGKGMATWNKGKAVSYDGEWKNGRMDGETTYILRNGDIFEGTFKDDHYDQGKYTEKSSGEYFEGTFKNGQPSKGRWYDRNGAVLEEI